MYNYLFSNGTNRKAASFLSRGQRDSILLITDPYLNPRDCTNLLFILNLYNKGGPRPARPSQQNWNLISSRAEIPLSSSLEKTDLNPTHPTMALTIQHI